MTPNNNLSILPFYSSLSKQNHRKDYAFGNIYPLVVPDKHILPFQIIVDPGANPTGAINLYKLDGTLVRNLSAEMLATGYTVNQYTSEGYDVIKYPGVLPLTGDTPEGLYYLMISDGRDWWYSEVFNVVRKVTDFLKIEFYDDASLDLGNGLIDYGDSFKFWVYLNTQLGRPEYPFEEEVEKRDGYTFVEKQISEKTFKFVFLAPEYLCDAMRLIRMSDYVTITSKGEEYRVDNFLMTPTWEDGGHLAKVQCEFQCDTVIKKIGKGQVDSLLGDFNEDFNEDYNL